MQDTQYVICESRGMSLFEQRRTAVYLRPLCSIRHQLAEGLHTTAITISQATGTWFGAIWCYCYMSAIVLTIMLSSGNG